MPRTAREAFLQSSTRLEFERMAATVAFDTACEYALLAFLEEQPIDENPNSGWGRDCQRVGAQRVLQILRTIYQKQVIPEPERPKTLHPPK